MANQIAPVRDAGQAEGSLRLCAVTRVQLPPGELIRFVAGPDGQIVPDLANRLPGRGVWIGALKERVDEAVGAKAFQRSLKHAVDVPADLAARVEALMEKRTSDALALANKAGLVTAGFEKVSALVGKGRAFAIVNAADGSEDGSSKIERKFAALSNADHRSKKAFRCLTIRQMSLALGRANVVHGALTPGGAAQRFVAEAERLTRYRQQSGHMGLDDGKAILGSGTEHA